MDVNEDINKAVSTTRWLLRNAGLWPNLEEDCKNASAGSKYKFLFPVSLTIFFVMIPQIIDLFVIWGDLEETLDNLSLVNGLVIMEVCLTFTFRYHMEDLKPIMMVLVEDWLAPKTAQERESMLSKARLSKFMVMGAYLLTEIMVVGYYGLHIYTNILAGEENRRLFYRSYFPFDVRPTPVYQITVFVQIIGIQTAILTLTGINGFITLVVFHACGQFVNLRVDMQNLVPKDYEDVDQRGFWSRVVPIVRKHRRLIRFASAVENLFNKTVLAQIIVCTVQMGLQGYLVYMASNNGKKELHAFATIVMTFYLLFVMTHVFMLCFQGEMLLKESAAFAYAAYECNWTSLRWRNAKALLIIMTRSRIPLFLTAGKFSKLSLELFGKILKTSFTYCSVLLTVVKD